MEPRTVDQITLKKESHCSYMKCSQSLSPQLCCGWQAFAHGLSHPIQNNGITDNGLFTVRMVLTTHKILGYTPCEKAPKQVNRNPGLGWRGLCSFIPSPGKASVSPQLVPWEEEHPADLRARAQVPRTPYAVPFALSTFPLAFPMPLLS